MPRINPGQISSIQGMKLASPTKQTDSASLSKKQVVKMNAQPPDQVELTSKTEKLTGIGRAAEKAGSHAASSSRVAKYVRANSVVQMPPEQESTLPPTEGDASGGMVETAVQEPEPVIITADPPVIEEPVEEPIIEAAETDILEETVIPERDSALVAESVESLGDAVEYTKDYVNLLASSNFVLQDIAGQMDEVLNDMEAMLEDELATTSFESLESAASEMETLQTSIAEETAILGSYSEELMGAYGAAIDTHLTESYNLLAESEAVAAETTQEGADVVA